MKILNTKTLALSSMEKWVCLLIFVCALSGCVVFDKFSSGERRIPVSSYAGREFDSEQNKLHKIRVVYEKEHLDVYTYVVAFDGTNNSSDCDFIFGGKRNLVDAITSKPFCTTVRRLTQEIAYIPFGSKAAPRTTIYYDGPGAMFGRFTNPLDSFLGYTSGRISQRALSDFARNIEQLPPDVKEVRLVAIGFSRGAAIARDFVNHAHNWWAKRSGTSSTEIWSTLLLYDTVATFQQDKLELSINPKTDQVIHMMSVNESRNEFRPIVDNPVGNAASFDRLIVLKLPGAHSDVGVAYRYGANVLADYIAHRAAQEMGLLESIAIAYGEQPNFGLVESRGWWDRLTGTPSGYACNYKRVPQKSVRFAFSEQEFRAYAERALLRRDARAIQVSASRSSSSHQPIAIWSTSSKDDWKVIPISDIDMGTIARYFKDGHGKHNIKFLDGINKGRVVTLPDAVYAEIQSYQGKEVQLEITGLTSISTRKSAEGFWFFVNGCVPTEGRL